MRIAKRFKIQHWNAVSYCVLIGLSAVFLAPFLWSALTSVKINSEIYRSPIQILPQTLSYEHYRYVVTGIPDFVTYFNNSVIVSLISVTLVGVVSSLAGYALGRFKFRGDRLVLLFVLLVLALPWGIFLIPIYIMEDFFGLVNTNTGLVLPYVALNLPLAIIIMRGTFRSIPMALEDAARIDGCNSFQLWSRVMMPLARGGLAASTIFTFITVWGEFMYARTLMLTNETKTLAVGITDLRIEGGSWAFGTLSATILLSLIPSLLLFILLEKHFTRAILEGSLKG